MTGTGDRRTEAPNKMGNPLRIGLVGAGANTGTRHIPGLRGIEGVEIVAVSNRRPESSAAAAREFGIPTRSTHGMAPSPTSASMRPVFRPFRETPDGGMTAAGA